MKKGLTQVELLLTVAILAILFVLGTVIFSNFSRQDLILNEARKIKSVISEAQTKTVAGFKLGGSQALNFGVYFSSDSYVLFSGTTYDPLNVNNQELVLPENLELTTIDLPDSSLVFTKITGEVTNYNPVLNNLILRDQTIGQEKKIIINQLGMIGLEDP